MVHSPNGRSGTGICSQRSNRGTTTNAIKITPVHHNQRGNGWIAAGPSRRLDQVRKDAADYDCSSPQA